MQHKHYFIIQVLLATMSLIAQANNEDVTQNVECINRKHCVVPGIHGPQGPIGFAGLPGAQTNNFLFADSALRQPHTAGNNVLQNIILENVRLADGWTTADNNNFTCPATGLYAVTYKVSLDRFGGNITTVVALFNGMQIAGSSCSVNEHPDDDLSVFTVSGFFLMQATIGQNFKLQFADTTNTARINFADFAGSPIASKTTVELTIIRIL